MPCAADAIQVVSASLSSMVVREEVLRGHGHSVTVLVRRLEPKGLIIIGLETPTFSGYAIRDEVPEDVVGFLRGSI